MPDDLVSERIKKLEALKEAGIDPWGNRCEVTGPNDEVIELFRDDDEVRVRVAGRLSSVRRMGKSIFADIVDFSGKIQVYLKKNVLGDNAFSQFELADLGDRLGVEGTLFRTRTGEVTVQATSYWFLGKAVRPLPLGKEYVGEDG